MVENFPVGDQPFKHVGSIRAQELINPDYRHPSFDPFVNNGPANIDFLAQLFQCDDIFDLYHLLHFQPPLVAPMI
jgi:hypothetical protein